MNKSRRETLRKAIILLGYAVDLVQQASDEEEDCMDNIPENLADSDRYQKMENAVDNMADAIEYIESAEESINSAME